MSRNPEPTIRRAKLEDAGLLAELGARTFSETFAADNSPEDMAAYLAASFNPARQAAELNDPASIFFIAQTARCITTSLCGSEPSWKMCSPTSWKSHLR